MLTATATAVDCFYPPFTALVRAHRMQCGLHWHLWTNNRFSCSPSATVKASFTEIKEEWTKEIPFFCFLIGTKIPHFEFECFRCLNRFVRSVCSTHSRENIFFVVFINCKFLWIFFYWTTTKLTEKYCENWTTRASVTFFVQIVSWTFWWFAKTKVHLWAKSDILYADFVESVPQINQKEKRKKSGKIVVNFHRPIGHSDTKKVNFDFFSIFYSRLSQLRQYMLHLIISFEYLFRCFKLESVDLLMFRGENESNNFRSCQCLWVSSVVLSDFISDSIQCLIDWLNISIHCYELNGEYFCMRTIQS